MYVLHLTVSPFQQRSIYDKRTKGERLQKAVSAHGKRTLEDVLSSGDESEDESGHESDEESTTIEGDEETGLTPTPRVRKRRCAVLVDGDEGEVPQAEKRPSVLVDSTDDDGSSDDAADDAAALHRDDIVALVESRSTPTQPRVLLGKVLRLKKRTAVLAWLQPTSMKKKYRLCIGENKWTESVDALVHPIDIVYCQKTNLYTLRTPLVDIHNYVHVHTPD